MRRMGQRRATRKSPIPGMTIGLTIVFIISVLATVRSNRLVAVARGRKAETASSKVVTRDDHPTGAERDFLRTLVKQSLEITE